MMKQILIPVWSCECENCKHPWQTRSDVIPKVCPNCSTTGYNKSGIVEMDNQAEAVPAPLVASKPIAKTVVTPDDCPVCGKFWRECVCNESEDVEVVPFEVL